MIHIICGNGRGKTTSAVGLLLRATGSGMKTAIFQFLKNGTSSEIRMLEKIGDITVRYCPECRTFTSMMTDDEKSQVTARHNIMLSEAEKLISSRDARLIVLDEIFAAYNTGFLDRALAEKIVSSCPDDVELVLTGRGPAPFFCELADYHSEILAVKHPYEKGIAARKGIEF